MCVEGRRVVGVYIGTAVGRGARGLVGGCVLSTSGGSV